MKRFWTAYGLCAINSVPNISCKQIGCKQGLKFNFFSKNILEKWRTLRFSKKCNNFIGTKTQIAIVEKNNEARSDPCQDRFLCSATNVNSKTLQ